jgi:hypothetical protein
MKIRNGFVSNSSTSSFVIYGIRVHNGDIQGIAEKLGVDLIGTRDECSCQEEGYDKDIDDLAEDIADLLELELQTGQEGYCYYFGADPTYIGDDETGRQFKENIEKPIKEKLGEEYKCSYHEEAWRDG